MLEQFSFPEGWTTETIGGIFDRQGRRYIVFDVDATRQAARQHAFPCDPMLSTARRRFDAVCEPGDIWRKRGRWDELVPQRAEMYTRQWIGTYGNRGNGDYQSKLAAALQAIKTYLAHFALTTETAEGKSRWTIWQCGCDCPTRYESGVSLITRGKRIGC